jgi:hypothetical protein
MTLPRYLAKDAEPGRVVTQGEYIGETQGRFGPQHNFVEIGTGQHVVLSGGSLNWRVEQGHIVEGGVYDVDYLGKKTMEKGDFAGKETKDYKFSTYEDSELPEAFLKKRSGAATPAKAAAGSAPSAPAVKSPETEALDDLS